MQDHFDTVNEFYGAEFGFEGEYRYRGWTLEGMVKLAAGWDVTHVNINGASFITLPNQPTTASTGGLLALPSNIGVYRRTDITLIPEVGVNLAYDLTSNIRIRAGYDFLYWEHVNRPGQQIDTNVNTNLIPPGPGGQPRGQRKQLPGPTCSCTVSFLGSNCDIKRPWTVDRCESWTVANRGPLRIVDRCESWTVDRGPWTVDRGPWTVDRGPWTVDRGPWIVDRGPWTVDRGSGKQKAGH